MRHLFATLALALASCAPDYTPACRLVSSAPLVEGGSWELSRDAARVVARSARVEAGAVVARVVAAPLSGAPDTDLEVPLTGLSPPSDGQAPLFSWNGTAVGAPVVLSRMVVAPDGSAHLRSAVQWWSWKPGALQADSVDVPGTSCDDCQPLLDVRRGAGRTILLVTRQGADGPPLLFALDDAGAVKASASFAGWLMIWPGREDAVAVVTDMDSLLLLDGGLNPLFSPVPGIGFLVPADWDLFPPYVASARTVDGSALVRTLVPGGGEAMPEARVTDGSVAAITRGARGLGLVTLSGTGPALFFAHVGYDGQKRGPDVRLGEASPAPGILGEAAPGTFTYTWSADEGLMRAEVACE